MATHYKPHKAYPCEDGKPRTVYIKGEFAPFVGWVPVPDSAWSCAAYVRIGGKRCVGYVCTERGEFRPLNSHAHMMPGIPPRKA